MEITIKKTIEEKIQIALPAYIKTNCHFYKVISEKQAIQVCTLNGYKSINQIYPDVVFFTLKETSTKEEFNNAFNQISKELCEIANI